MSTQCKDIPDRPILEFLLKHKDNYCTWFPGYGDSVTNVMPAGIPDKLILAKMRGLIKRGLVIGCACGCRGDFKISEKGEEVLFAV